MPTLARKVEQVGAEDVRFVDDTLVVALSDGREVSLRLSRVEWLRWLAKATPAQQANWVLEPGGFAIYWPELDDGIEVCHLLAIQPLS